MATLNNVITNANGCVGIGTSSPTVKLDVVGSATVSNVLTVTGTTALNGAVNLSTSGTPTITLGSASSYGVLTASGTNAASIYLNGASRTGFEAKLQFGAAEHQWFNGSLSSQIMTLNTTGLGIGTSSTAYKLDVNGLAASSNGFLSKGAFSGMSGLSGALIDYDSGNTRIISNTAAGNSTISFLIGNSSAFSNAMVINSTGNVGIGTTNTVGKLDLVGNFIINGASNSNIAQQVFTRSDVSWGIFNETDLRFYSSNSNTTSPSTLRMAITSNGHVGIGTSNTFSGLQIQTEGTNTTSGSFLFVRSTNASFGGGAIGVGYQYAAAVGNNFTPFRIRAGTTNAIFTVNSAGTIYAGDSTGAIAYGNHDPYFAFNQDTNTGMDWASSDTLTFKTGGTERVRIDSTGCVGIGTTSVKSNSLLTVNGPGNFGASSYGFYIGTDGTGTYLDAGSQLIRMFAGSSERIRIDTTGNVYIGQTSASSGGKLSVAGTMVSSNYPYVISAYENFTSGSGNGGGIGFSGKNAGGLEAIQAAVQGVFETTGSLASDYRSGLRFLTRNESTSTLTERMRINYIGNVGIGTTSPSGSFHIYKSTSYNTILETTTANNVQLRFRKSGTDKWSIYVGNSSNDLTLWDGTSDRVTFQNGGNVGIGTSSPAALLNAYRNSNTTAPIGYFQDVYGSPAKTNVVLVERLNNLSNTNVSASSAGVRIRDHSNNYALSVEDHSGNSYMVIKGGGNVGIGTTSPAQKLSINNGSAGGSGAVYPIRLSGGTMSSANDATGIQFVQRDAFNDYGGYIRLLNTQGNPTYLNPRLEFGVQNTDTNVLGSVTTKMVITGDGNVGIGTTAPASKLEVYCTSSINTSNYYGLSRYNASLTSNASNGQVGILFSTLSNSSLPANASIHAVPVSDYRSGIVSTYSADAFGAGYFYVNQFIPVSSATVTRFAINNDGNVGIGTTSPVAKLHIDDASSPYIRITRSGTPTWELRNNYPSTEYGFSINNVTAGTTVLFAGQSGNIGIGTTSPAYILDIVSSTPRLHLKETGLSHATLDVENNAGSFYFGIDNSAGTGFGGTAYAGTIYKQGAYPIAFWTNAAERMRIAAGGNVGIGSTSPNDKLDVVGRVYAYRYIAVSSNASSPAYATDSSTGMYNAATNQIGFSISGTEKLRIDSNGNVGIGTTTVSYKLDVNAAAASYALRLLGSSVDGPVIRFESTAGSGRTYHVGSTAPPSGAGTGFSIYDVTANSSRMLIDANGNVGLGTTSPDAKLIVKSSSPGPYGTGTPDFAIAGNGGGNLTSLQIYRGANTGSYIGIDAFRSGISGTPLVLNAANSGNVGIGTTSPLGKLHIYGFLRVGGAANEQTGIIALGNDAHPTATYGDNGIFRGGIGSLGSANYLNVCSYQGIVFNVGNAGFGSQGTRMLIDVNGNVGIGTTSPAYKLEVNGSLYATRLSGSAMFTTSGKGRFYGTASYALAAPAGSSLTGQTDSATPFETSLGYQAGNVNTGTGNTAIGYQALLNNTTGTGSIAIGYQALYTNTRGKRNIAIGYEALRTTQGSTDVYGDPIGDENVAIGYQAARAAFNINRVVAIGHRALANNLAGGNVAIGWRAMESNVGTANSNLGILNTAVGTMALFSNTSGNSNSAFGYNALTSNITGNENTAVGHRASLYNSTGKSNGSFGSYALYYNQVGNNNNAFGNYCLYTNGGNNNSAFGHRALYSNTTGTNNCAFGSGSLWKNTSGTKNTAIGGNAGSTITTGGNLSVFGYNAQASSATATNEVTLGNASVATLRCQVTTITALSDFRDKTDINNVEVGLSFVEKLRPVTFKWDKREWYTDGNRDGSKKDTITQIGFIAQELKALQESENATYLNLVYESNPDKLEATPGNLMVPLIKAVQELSVMVKQQRVEFDDKITKQQLEIDYLKSKLNN